MVSENGSPYCMKSSDAYSFTCSIVTDNGNAEIPYVREPMNLVNQSSIKVSFTAKVSGIYKMKLKLATNTWEINRKYLPGKHVIQ